MFICTIILGIDHQIIFSETFSRDFKNQDDASEYCFGKLQDIAISVGYENIIQKGEMILKMAKDHQYSLNFWMANFEPEIIVTDSLLSEDGNYYQNEYTIDAKMLYRSTNMVLFTIGSYFTAVPKFHFAKDKYLQIVIDGERSITRYISPKPPIKSCSNTLLVEMVYMSDSLLFQVPISKLVTGDITLDDIKLISPKNESG